jgi:prepilin-type N-terminal cleavage/methylation domain-containing protein
VDPRFLMRIAPSSRHGFTLIEVMIALVILSGVLLTLAASTTRYLSIITKNRIRIQSGAVADAQISAVRVAPNYQTLGTQFDGTLANVPLPGYSRETRLVRTGAGTTADRTGVVVRVTGPHLATPVIRYATIAAP